MHMYAHKYTLDARTFKFEVRMCTIKCWRTQIIRNVQTSWRPSSYASVFMHRHWQLTLFGPTYSNLCPPFSMPKNRETQTHLISPSSVFNRHAFVDGAFFELSPDKQHFNEFGLFVTKREMDVGIFFSWQHVCQVHIEE